MEMAGGDEIEAIKVSAVDYRALEAEGEDHLRDRHKMDGVEEECLK